MLKPPDVFVIDESVLFRAILDPDGFASEAMRHLRSSPAETAVLPECAAQRFYRFAADGILASSDDPDNPAQQIRVRANVIARWQAAHANLFGSTTGRPTVRSSSSSRLKPCLQEIVATAVEVGVEYVISEWPSAVTHVDGVRIITARQFYELIDP